MGQIAKEQQEMTEQEKEAEKRNLSNRGGGAVSAEELENSSGETEKEKTGQDHSTENHEDQAPREGIGAVQDSFLIKEDVANIEK